MRVLIDTNILVSALLCDGLPESVILWVLNNPEWEWVVSASIMQEYEAVLRRKKFKFSDDFVNRWLELILASVTVYLPTANIDFPRDSNDAKFLECAEIARADLFITGDRDFEEAEGIIDTFIISVTNFVRLFMQSNHGSKNN